MAKQYIIRHKETHKQLFTSRGKKGAWKTAGHAKAAFTNFTFHTWHWKDLGVNLNGNVRFDDQDVFEIVAVEPVDDQRLAHAEELLSRAYHFLDNVHAYESDIANDIRKYFGSQE